MAPTSTPQIAGQRLPKAFPFTERPRGQAEYDAQQITPTATWESLSAPKRLKEIDAEAEARHAGLHGKLIWGGTVVVNGSFR